MKEYGNFYDRDDLAIGALDPLYSCELQRMITYVKDKFPLDVEKQKEVVMRECSHYWPMDLKNVSKEQKILWGWKDKEDMKDVYKEYIIEVSSNMTCVVKAFKYQGKKWFYWWDIYQNSQLIKSGLEFFPWYNHPASYIIFATELTQAPLMYTEQFKHIRQF